MERYLGIDPHRDSCTLALVSPQGKKVKQMVVPTEGSELVKTVREIRGPLHVCVEEGEWISRGAIPVEEALPLFLQIADGLEEAHEKGVVHRDLKPANIKISNGGDVKILGFGLAKAMAPEVDTSAPGLSQSPSRGATRCT